MNKIKRICSDCKITILTSNKDDKYICPDCREENEILNIHNEGVIEGRQEALAKVGEVIDKLPCYLLEKIDEEGNRTGEQEPGIRREELKKQLGLSQ